MLTPNPNECNFTLTSGTKNIYPYPYKDVDDRGHCLRSGSPVILNFLQNKVQFDFRSIKKRICSITSSRHVNITF